MKKLTLLFAAAALAFGANAQQRALGTFELQKSKVAVPDYTHPVASTKPGTANKGTGTIGGTNWFIPYDLYNELNSEAFESSSGLNNITLTYIWFDSTVKQRFSTGLGTINYISMAQVIDPISTTSLFDDASFNGTIDITNNDSFVVDSVFVRGAYIKQPTRPSTIVDTLILSVAPATRSYYLPKATYSWVGNYTTHDTLWGPAPTSVDSVNRAAFSSTTGARAMWKVPLTAAMRDTIDASTGNITVKGFTFAVPNGGLGFSAGTHVGMTVTFKSGDTWTRNVDSVTKFHRFAPISGYVTSGGAMPFYWYDYQGTYYGDRNGSSMMFSTDSSFYEPSIFIEGFNTNDYNKEFHDFGVHISCPTCRQLSVKNVASNIASVMAVPNPANNTVSIPVTMKESANVTVSLINTLGQTVKAQELGNVNAGQKATASFNTADLASGLYIYSVSANGQRTTGRIVVAH